jgi:pimeloyl-ACP methyl ester carboxylesterase
MTTPSLLLLPGHHGTTELFAPFLNAAPKNIKTIPVDYPGERWSFDDLESFAREKLVDPCVVLAESFSGPIGVRIASDDRVRALVLCSSFVSSPSRVGRLAIAPLFSLPFPAFIIRILLSGRHADPTVVTGVQTALRRLPGGVVARRIRQVARADERQRARDLHKPILYLRGLRDNVVSERSWQELSQVRPDARIARILGPHMLLQVSPEECWRAIMKFVDEALH